MFTFDCKDTEIQELREPERNAALGFLSVFSHIATSLYLAEVEKVDSERHKIVQEMLSVKGFLDEVVNSLGCIWCKLFSADAARFWIYNENFDELDLLNIYCNHCPEIRTAVENQLPMDSYSGLSLSNGLVLKSWKTEAYSISKEARDRPNSEKLCKLWPHFVCLPLYISKRADDEGKDNRKFFGVLDLHWRKQPTITHPDERLFFLGHLTSMVISGSQVQERRRVVEKLNKIALAFVSPTKLMPLGERREEYL
ncbi:MAG: hypothetical protein C4B58_06905 [Deltaproteobacteria bacterium]|nr:MAG: hypothetical protein C4B58_06905 [Deltaproteobacteria bacterium]